MKVILFIWITILFLMPCGLPAQNEDPSRNEIGYNYDLYRQTFEAEVKGLETPGENINTANTFMYSEVPGWLTERLDTSSSTFIVTGISDPLEDTALAYKQAFIRALYMASLMTTATVSNLVDNFSEDADSKSLQVSGQYIDYFEIESHVSTEITHARIIRKAFSDFGECILMVEVRAPWAMEPVMRFKTVGMITEFEKSGVYECNARIELDGKAPGVDFRYISRSVNGLIEAESWHDDNLLTLKTDRLKYLLPKPVIENQFPGGVKTDRGLWNAYLNAVIKEVTVKLRLAPAQLSSSSDNYTKKTQSLNRESTQGNITFRLDHIFIDNNRLTAIIDQFNFTQP